MKLKAKTIANPDDLSLPKSVAVGGFVYTIHPWDHDEAVASNLLGYCDNVKTYIKIADGLNYQLRAEVLLHEVMHAIFRQAGVDAAPEAEEKIVSGMTYGLIGVIRHNPDFMPYLKRLLDRHQS